MKKVLAGLVSISFLAVLLVPTLVLAIDNCPNWSCQGPVGTVPCMCGDDTKAADSSYYCWGDANGGDGRVFSTQSACQSAMSGGTSGGGAGYVPIPGEGEAPSTPEELIALIEDIGNWIFTALLVIAAIFLVIAGFRFIFAGGNEENVRKARQMLINALIGVAVALAAKGLVAVIRGLILS
jgi:hypothetical protein